MDHQVSHPQKTCTHHYHHRLSTTQPHHHKHGSVRSHHHRHHHQIFSRGSPIESWVLFAFISIFILFTHQIEGISGARITSLLVPKWIENGTEASVVLDCLYSLGHYTGVGRVDLHPSRPTNGEAAMDMVTMPNPYFSMNHHPFLRDDSGRFLAPPSSNPHAASLMMQRQRAQLTRQSQERDEGRKLIVKWYKDLDDEHLEPIYEWVPSSNFRYVAHWLQDRIDLDYHVNSDPWMKYRALKFNAIDIDLTGKYMCTIESLTNQHDKGSFADAKSANMVVYAPPKEFVFTYETRGGRMKDILADNMAMLDEADEAVITLKINGIYPLPKIELLQVCNPNQPAANPHATSASAPHSTIPTAPSSTRHPDNDQLLTVQRIEVNSESGVINWFKDDDDENEIDQNENKVKQRQHGHHGEANEADVDDDEDEDNDDLNEVNSDEDSVEIRPTKHAKSRKLHKRQAAAKRPQSPASPKSKDTKRSKKSAAKSKVKSSPSKVKKLSPPPHKRKLKPYDLHYEIVIDLTTAMMNMRNNPKECANDMKSDQGIFVVKVSIPGTEYVTQRQIRIPLNGHSTFEPHIDTHSPNLTLSASVSPNSRHAAPKSSKSTGGHQKSVSGSPPSHQQASRLTVNGEKSSVNPANGSTSAAISCHGLAANGSILLLFILLAIAFQHPI